MYLRIKVSCDCGCSYSIDNSTDRPHEYKCPNCHGRALPNTCECLSNILNYANAISFETGHVRSVSFKANAST